DELDELAGMYEALGLKAATARTVAEELTEHDAVKAHLHIELNLDEEDLTSPTQAGVASAISFTIGGLIPLVSILLASTGARFAVTFIAVLIALTITGYASATVGKASRSRAIIRVIIGGAAAMIGTFLVGRIF